MTITRFPVAAARLPVALFAFLSLFSASADTVYSIQMGAFSKPEGADALTAQLASQGNPDAFVRREESDLRQPHKVFSGRFETYSEAWAARNLLPAKLSTGTFVVKWQDDSTTAAPSSPAPRLFQVDDLAGRSSAQHSGARAAELLAGLPLESATATPSEAVLTKQADRMNRDELLAVGLRAAKNPQGVPALEKFLERHPSDPAANTARLRLARRLLARKDKQRIPALLETVRATGTREEKGRAALIAAYARASMNGSSGGFLAFQELAGDTSLDPVIRHHAMRQAAGSAHAAREYTTAVLAFQQIEQVAPTPEERAEARLQRVGIAFELAGRGKGSWVEVQGLCNSVEKMPAVPRATVATARLMHLEAAFYDNRAADALAEAEAFLTTFPDIRREWVSASVWKGVLLAKVGRFADAEAALNAVLKMPLTASDKFGKHEPHARAAAWLSFLAMQRGDLASRDAHLALLREKFPNTPEAAATSKLAQASPAAPRQQ